MNSLFHPEYETYTDEANKIAEDFSKLTKPFIEKLCNEYKTYEIESILKNEIIVIVSWIKLDREHKRWKESKGLLKNFIETNMDTPSTIGGAYPITVSFKDCIDSNNFIDAIKVVRALTKCGLKDAKEFVDNYISKKSEVKEEGK